MEIHLVKYEGRLTKELDIWLLKKQKLKGFLIERLAQEITPESFYANLKP